MIIYQYPFKISPPTTRNKLVELMIGCDVGKAYRKLANEGNLKGLEAAWTLELMNAKGSPSGKTALHFSASKGHTKAVQFLVSKDANLNEPDAALNTPLMLALMGGHRETAIFLLNANAKIISKNKDNLNPLQLAKNHPTLKNDPEIINLIKSKIYYQAYQEYTQRGEVHISESGEIICAIEALTQAMAKVKLEEPPFQFPDLEKTRELFKSDIVKISNVFSPSQSQEFFNTHCGFVHMQVDNYFQAKDPHSHFVDPKIKSLLELWSKTLEILKNLIASDEKILKAAANDRSKGNLLAVVFLFRTIAYYDNFVDKLNKCPNPNATELKEIKEALELLVDSNSMIHYFSGAKDLNETYQKIKTLLLVNVRRFSARFNSLWFDYDEMQFHIDRKTDYHAELIYNPNPLSMTGLDEHCLNVLVSKIKNIINGQPRTQFIVDISGHGHALVCDVSWDKENQQVQIICVESTTLVIQYEFLLELRARLCKEGIANNIIAIQAGLQHDKSSCYTFAYLISRALSKFTFAKLEKAKEIHQPAFYSNRKFTDFMLIPSDPPRTPPVKWLPITALGEKVVRMGQSFTSMRENLLKIYPKREEHVDTLIAHWKKCYQSEPDLYLTEEEKLSSQSYITFRRHSLRLKYKGTPFEGITLDKIYHYTNATTPGQALKRLAAGWGPLGHLRYLLSTHPQAMNELGGKENLTALDWAYKKKQTHRATVLEEAGAKRSSELIKRKM